MLELAASEVADSTALVSQVRHQLLLVNCGCWAESVALSLIKANGFALPGHDVVGTAAARGSGSASDAVCGSVSGNV